MTSFPQCRKTYSAPWAALSQKLYRRAGCSAGYKGFDHAPLQAPFMMLLGEAKQDHANQGHYDKAGYEVLLHG
jgi:hypothetical protein